jgi:hypothetical protein
MVLMTLVWVSGNTLTMLVGGYADVHVVHCLLGETYSELVSEETTGLGLLVFPRRPSMLLGSSGRGVLAEHGAESENEAERWQRKLKPSRGDIRTREHVWIRRFDQRI